MKGSVILVFCLFAVISAFPADEIKFGESEPAPGAINGNEPQPATDDEASNRHHYWGYRPSYNYYNPYYSYRPYYGYNYYTPSYYGGYYYGK